MGRADCPPIRALFFSRCLAYSRVNVCIELGQSCLGSPPVQCLIAAGGGCSCSKQLSIKLQLLGRFSTEARKSAKMLVVAMDPNDKLGHAEAQDLPPLAA